MKLAVKVNPYILILRCVFCFSNSVPCTNMVGHRGGRGMPNHSSLQKTKPCSRAYTPPHLGELLRLLIISEEGQSCPPYSRRLRCRLETITWIRETPKEGAGCLCLAGQPDSNPSAAGEIASCSTSWMTEHFQAAATLPWPVAPKGSTSKKKGKKDHVYTNGPDNPSVAAQTFLGYIWFSTSQTPGCCCQKESTFHSAVRNQRLLNMYTTTFNKYLLSAYDVPDSVLDA